MNTALKLGLMAILLSFGGWMSVLFASDRKINMNKGWKFHLGSTSNAEQAVCNDSKWRTLDLPHDWSVEPAPIQKEGITIGPFSQMTESGAGGADTGQTLGGEGWYRKEFTIAKEDAGKLFSLYFEGAYNQAEVWINGQKAYFNPYGYTSFKFDVTDYCNPPGQSNVIAVKVVNVGQNSRWYSGSGIYRPVWLLKTDKTHLNEWDTFVDASELKKQSATVKFGTIVHNKGSKKSAGSLTIQVLSPAGKEVYASTKEVAIPASGEMPVSVSFDIDKPALWSVESPALYSAEVSLLIDGQEPDKLSIPFGIRSISFNADKGFLLNGKPVKLKGACIHHDNGLLGAVAINRAEERKVELLKANGYNAVRCAHNQVSEHFLHACDQLGILVIHETFDQWQKPKREQDYHQFFDEWSEKDLIASIRRDRNHPSIIMWSIGNEIEQRADSVGEVIAQRLVKAIKRYDNSRFSTVGANDFWDRRHFSWDTDSHRAFRNVDVAGYNYVWWKYESDHAMYPERIIYGSESYPKDAALNWNLVEKHPYIIGDFVWTAIDYIGEAGLGHAFDLAEGEHDSQFMGWPWYNAWCGDIDLCGDKKPQSYYRDIVWREREISVAVHPPIAAGKKEVVNGWGWTNELLSWNWAGLEGQTMQVNVYSRAHKVRLYLNDKLIGEKEVGKENYTATFDVSYRKGILRAVNVVNKKESSFAELKTTGSPAAIRLSADRTKIRADKNDLAYVKIEIVDKDGNVVPDTDVAVQISCTGNGSVIAAGNAAPADMASFRSMTPNTFRGKAIAIVQPDEDGGEITLTVSAAGLDSVDMQIQAQ